MASWALFLGLAFALGWLLASRRTAVTEAHASGRDAARDAELDRQMESLRQANDRLLSAVAESRAELRTHLERTAQQQEGLQRETANLVRALRAPQVRGRWGELQLRRCVELAGMTEHIDFSEQVVTSDETGLRKPDLVVHLPGERTIVVDAKAPLDAYMDATEAQDEASRAAHLQRHARQLRAHVTELASRAYWERFGGSAELVVLFVPGEAVLSAAFEADRDLVDTALAQHVMLVGPTNLVSLLKTAAWYWRQERVAANAEEIRTVASELVDRVASVLGHVEDLGDQLRRAVQSYNAAVGSLESRLLPQARRVRELGADGRKAIPEGMAQVDVPVRRLPAADARDG